MKAIIVTGTPGVGKTTFSKNLVKEKGYVYVDVTKLIKVNELYLTKDKTRDCLVVDEKKLALFLENMIKKSKKTLVIDSHMSHYISPDFVKKCYVLKSDLKILKKRLLKRGYSKKKIQDNLECEIMEVCLSEAKENGHKVTVRVQS